jgi:hypothetical protein
MYLNQFRLAFIEIHHNNPLLKTTKSDVIL